MAKAFTRDEIREKFSASVSNNSPVIICDAGAGITAKFAQTGGADMISCSVSGYYRWDCIGSLAGIMPFKNANDVLIELADRIMPRIKNVPVCAGVAPQDPTRDMGRFYDELKRYGFSAVINNPSMGCVTGNYRNNCENANIGVKEEIRSLKDAQNMGFYTIANAYEKDTAIQAAELGLDALLVNLGFTDTGDRHSSLEDGAAKVRELAGAALEINPAMLILVHGGPITKPEDSAYIYRNSQAVGFFGESVFESIPAYQPIVDTVKEFAAAVLPEKEGK